ncbi:hypothetical protein SNEBB_005638 [Seison nebaliae]|nr:hypothetical protein SNEBB_005638 [Seison nebaliae]
MSVVGFDFGSHSCIVAVAKRGGIETIDNEYSKRMTPSVLSMLREGYAVGVDAKQQMVSNGKNTVTMLKRLFGRSFNDPFVQETRNMVPYRVVEGKNNNILVQFDHGDKKFYQSEELAALLLGKLKSIAEVHLKIPVNDCVISVPCFFTDVERRCIRVAAEICGLTPLRIMNDTAAVALSYGLYRTDLPPEHPTTTTNDKETKETTKEDKKDEKSTADNMEGNGSNTDESVAAAAAATSMSPPQNPSSSSTNGRVVVFVDCGYLSTQICCVNFFAGKLNILSTSFDNNLGGYHFDRKLGDYLRNEFQKKYKVDAYSTSKARQRLMNECERIKKLMSANSQNIPVNIECLINDMDVTTMINREIFEELCSDVVQRMDMIARDCMRNAKIDIDKVDSVVMVGGSSRIPMVKKVIKQIFQKDISTTLNADEAVARGCAIQCAILSPNFKVRDFKIEDNQMFPITISWKAEAGEDSDVEIIPENSNYPTTRMLSFFRNENCLLEARYTYPNDIPFPNPVIGRFIVHSLDDSMKKLDDIKPVSNERPKIKVKVRLDGNGLLVLKGATATVRYEDTTIVKDVKEGANEKEEKKSDDKNVRNIPIQKTAKIKSKLYDLRVDSQVFGYSPIDMNKMKEDFLQLMMLMKSIRERAEARNSMEEYVYEMRDKISSTFEKYVHPNDKEQFRNLLNLTEEWLYSEESEQASKGKYLEELNKMKKFGEPIRQRYLEGQHWIPACEQFGKSIQLLHKAVQQAESKEPQYDHISQEDLNKVRAMLSEKEKWFWNIVDERKRTPPYIDSKVSSSMCKNERHDLEKKAWKIMNQAKPTDPPPPPTPTDKPTTEKTNNDDEVQQENNNSVPSPQNNEMDVD